MIRKGLLYLAVPAFLLTAALPVTAQGIPDRVAALETQLAALTSAVQPANVTVDCSAGQSVNAALGQTARAIRVTITVTGVCTEAVGIRRDDVTLRGLSPADGLQAPSANAAVINVVGASRVTIRDLTVQGGHYGIKAAQGAAVGVSDVLVTGAALAGLHVTDAAVTVNTSTIEGGDSTGIDVRPGGYVSVTGSLVRNNGFQGISAGGSVVISQSTIQGNVTQGIFGWMGGTISVSQSSITGNGGSGITLHGGTLHVGSTSPTVIAGNGGPGISMFGGLADIGGITIENNIEAGIKAQGSAFVALSANTIIRNNAGNPGNGDSIRLSDTSVVGSQNATGIQITGNSRFGIFCDPPPAVAQITPHFSGVGFSINGSHVSGNMGGQISCPGLVIP